MDPARREELLKRWPAPWAAADLNGPFYLGPLKDLPESRPVIVCLSSPPYGDGNADLAALLVEAWNAHFGAKSPQSIEEAFAASFRQIFELLDEAPAVATQDEFGRLVLERVRAWKRDSEELVEIRKEADQEVGDVLAQAFADLARQDCRRAADRLAGCFDWSKAETALAAEVIFSEVRGLSRPPASSDRQVATGRCVDCHYTAPLWSLTNGLRVCPSCRSHAIVEVPG